MTYCLMSFWNGIVVTCGHLEFGLTNMGRASTDAGLIQEVLNQNLYHQGDAADLAGRGILCPSIEIAASGNVSRIGKVAKEL